MCGALLGGCGSDDEPAPPPSGLAVGLSEANPNLLPRTPFGHFRLIVNWAEVQPSPASPPNWDVAQPGCLRTLPPCRPYGGVRAQLRALAKRNPTPEVLVSFLGAPPWAAAAPRGCEDAAAQGRARELSPTGLKAYEALVKSLSELAVQEDVGIAHWSPWNEPNAGFFLGPQRERCDPAADPLSPGIYAELARTMKRALEAVRPEEDALVLGDLAAVQRPRPLYIPPAEWVGALPRDVVCSSALWAVHRYVGDKEARGELLAAIDRRGCDRPARLWITETGVGGPRPGKPRVGGSAALRRACRSMHGLLEDFARDPRVDMAFQYSYRDDDLFPVGLVSTALDRHFPVEAVWDAWAKAGPEKPAPELPVRCR